MITNNKITPVIYINDEELESEDVTLEVTEGEICPHCKEEFTYEQIKHVIPAANKALTDKIIVYLNKYRKDYKLDTCLRKAHFIAQIGAEMKFQEGKMTEGTRYSYTGLRINHDKYFSANQIIDDVILDSLEDHLTSIFKITDKDNVIITKTNLELKNILKEDQVSVNVAELYGYRKKDEDILKTIKEKVKNENKEEIEVVKYNIVILKRSKHFGIELLSRAYANRYENGDEQSREGYMYRGKGLKQITFKSNYKDFSEYRRDNPFPDDPNGYIDFTEITDQNNLKCKSDLLADANNVIYAVQSALWFYTKGNVYKNKHTFYWADKDNVEYASLAINGGLNGIKTRNENTKRAREENGFKVYKHYELFYKNGNEDQKEEVKNALTKLSKNNIKQVYDPQQDKEVDYNLKDLYAERLLTQLTEEPLKPIAFKGLKLKVNLNMDLKPIK